MYNSKFWQEYKLNIPELNEYQSSVLLGTLLGDSCLYKRGNNANVKFEQSLFHKDYLFHLYEIFKLYTFSGVYTRLNKDKSIKSSKNGVFHLELLLIQHLIFIIIYSIMKELLKI